MTMTRAELEQVRAAVDELIGIAVDENALYPSGRGEIALAILDAELAKPEAREWRVISEYQTGGEGQWFESSQLCRTKNDLDREIRFVTETEWYRLVRIESRTPAGPWERENE